MPECPECGVRSALHGNTTPLVSIIVVVFLDRDKLLKLLANLVPFRSEELELVVIDGGSDDGSRELLQERNADVDYWLSEPDKGIYDAMNKGLKAARGIWVLHINAGDGLLAVPYARLRSLPDDVDMLACRVEHPDHGFTFIPRMNWTFRYQTTLQHQGLFYRRVKHCGYDSSYRMLADVEATQRMVLAGSGVALSTDVVSIHHGGGISDVTNIDDEWARCVRGNYGVAHQYIRTYLFMPARELYKTLRRKLA